MLRHSSRLLVGSVLAAVVGLAAGCGASKGAPASAGSSSTPAASSSAIPSASPDPAAVGQLPAAVKSSGTLTVAADATYAPNEFIATDGHTVIGMDADLAHAIAQVLGLRAQVSNATFDTIIPAIQSGRYDLGMSSFTDTKAREKTVTFVTYFSAGTSFFVSTNGGPTINSLADLCGHKVAVEKGTTQQMDAETQNAACKKAGKPAVQVEVFNDQNGANLALSSGRADVSMADSPVAAYQVKLSNGAFKLSGQAYGTAPYGIAMAKNSGLAQPILSAVKDLIANGIYGKIMNKWGIAAGAISNPVINGATS